MRKIHLGYSTQPAVCSWANSQRISYEKYPEISKRSNKQLSRVDGVHCAGYIYNIVLFPGFPRDIPWDTSPDAAVFRGPWYAAGSPVETQSRIQTVKPTNIELDTLYKVFGTSRGTLHRTPHCIPWYPVGSPVKTKSEKHNFVKP